MCPLVPYLRLYEPVLILLALLCPLELRRGLVTVRSV